MRRLLLAPCFVLGLLNLSPAGGQQPQYAGPTDKGFLLPNGWTLTPAGRQVTIEPKSDKVLHTASLGGRPYDVLQARNGLLYVSDWAGKQVVVVRPDDQRVIARIAVGEHPNQLALHPKDDRLFVACASSN